MAPLRYTPLPLPRKTRSPVAVRGVKKATQYRVPQFSAVLNSRPVCNRAPDRARRDQNGIEREQPTFDRRYTQATTGFREVYEDQDVEVSEQEPAESCLFHWEDEKTLVSDMMHDGRSADEESEDLKLCSLAESIQDSLSLYSKELIDDIADTLVPAANRVKQAHEVLNREMDGEFAEGLQSFVQGCHQMEDVTIRESKRVREVYCDSQTRVVELFKSLHDACMRRDQLWKDLERNLEEIINPTKERIKSLPTHMEHTIANLEKQSKQIAQKKDNGGTEKLYKSLLSNLI
ncbi:hypothetical protein E1B28_008942 [Marasmius oreades]|uniref:Uncharacterized protein n=1 Tax=Marasmius oreades TaxID=181124 RepID=A0A9P7UUT0_9AGAR|nr:uncharacterized protein E1B28_008942 [Marasmius oreades]KAG7092599.1 hypothetical protein E1B28_008942 [Marasmius oreades]